MYMKKNFFIVAVAALLAVSCNFAVTGGKVIKGSGVIESRTLSLPEFNSISVLGSMDVFYTQGPQEVVLTADDNLLDYYKVEVIDGVLTIGTEKGVSISSSKNAPFLTVSAGDLSGMSVHGSGDCNINGPFRTEGDFSFIVAGSGDLEADAIDCARFISKVRGSGDVDVDALTCKAAELSVAGSGDISVCCKDAGDISVRIMGSGDVTLTGTASSLESKVSGSGSVNSKGLKLN